MNFRDVPLTNKHLRAICSINVLLDAIKCAYDEVKELMNKFDVEKLCYVAADGVGRVMREDLIGYSGHILSIVRKK